MTKIKGCETVVKERGRETGRQRRNEKAEEKVQDRSEDGEEEGEIAWEEIREWKEKRSRFRLLPKVSARSHIEVEEVNLLQVSLFLQNGHHLATQERSLR